LANNRSWYSQNFPCSRAQPYEVFAGIIDEELERAARK